MLRKIVRIPNNVLLNLKLSRHKGFQSPVVLHSQNANRFFHKTCSSLSNRCRTTEDDQWYNLRCDQAENSDKVTILGVGSVGIACAYAILMQKISRHVVLIDIDAKKLEGEWLDFVHSSIFLSECKVESSTDLAASQNSKVVVICAGSRQRGKETRMDLAQKNADLFKSIIPTLYHYNENAIFLITSNPVDVLSWVTWKLTGMPVNRVIGSGTYIDTARFMWFLSRQCNCDVTEINTMVLGEHGNSQVPIWSQTFYNKTLLIKDPEDENGREEDDPWNNIDEAVRVAGPQVRCLKGYTSTCIGMATADILDSLLHSRYKIRPVSTLAQGYYGICDEVFLSLPCDVDECGIRRIFKMPIDACESQKLRESAKLIKNVLCQIKI